MYILEKVSSPGWKLEAEEIGYCLQFLEPSICNHCKMTKQDYDTFMDTWWADTDHSQRDYDNEEYEPEVYFPDNYNTMTDLDKIHTLLGTACGCEFDFDIIEEDND